MINDTKKVYSALLNLGREIALPIDRLLQIEECHNFEQVPSKLAVELPESLKHIITYARENILKAHDIHKKYFDAKRRDFSFNVGDNIFIRNHELSDDESNRAKKFYPKWLGPFKIFKKYGDIYHVEGENLPISMNPKRYVSDLKPFFERKTDVKTQISLREA